MCTNPVCEAHNQKQRLVDRIVSFALILDNLRGQFSDGDGWTDKDDRLCIHIDAASEIITETAEMLTRAAMDHRLAIEEVEKEAEEAVDAVESDD